MALHVPLPATFRYALLALPPLMAAAYYNRNRGNADTPPGRPPRTIKISGAGGQGGVGPAGRKDSAI
ncbi:hypothetical protein E2562_031838 [Oryza meyeriana var. granulata]|uniref:Uncharacterized protein n=1 Tax=Oryza meyeriana var. granulata TaxID=110450 RepID=A0A6G1CTY9_9ORYZ|nr:hypothetical protein E2562_031838 [Oryza meyeriana var. granulata]